jgi:hypothetical protein
MLQNITSGDGLGNLIEGLQKKIWGFYENGLWRNAKRVDYLRERQI